jgi:hypothetical protein
MTPLARVFWNIVRVVVVLAILLASWQWFQDKINKK